MSVTYYNAVITLPANAILTSAYHGSILGQAVPVTYRAEPQTTITTGSGPPVVTYRVEVPIQNVEQSQTTPLPADITFPISSGPNRSTILTAELNIVSASASTSAFASSTMSTTISSSITSTIVTSVSSISGVDQTGTAGTSSSSAFRPSGFGQLSNTATTSSVLSSTTLAAVSVSSSDSSPASVSTQQGAGSNAAELAGVAIGCLIGGALVTGLVFFLLFRRRGSRHDRKSSSSERELSPLNGHGEAIYLAGGYHKVWEKQHPSNESDVAASNMARNTLNQIETFVDNFYQDTHGLDLSIEAQSELEDLDSRHLPASILTLISQAERPSLLIKHCLINFILSRTTPGGTRVAASFLPKEFASMETSSQTHAEISYDQALAQWRVLTAYLKHNFTLDETYITERDQAIATAAQQVCRAFEPWARSDYNTCLQSVMIIMKGASDLGIMLCSQQTSFEWRWDISDKPDLGTREPVHIIVRPGLDRTTDQSAIPMTVAMHLLEPQVAVLDRA